MAQLQLPSHSFLPPGGQQLPPLLQSFPPNATQTSSNSNSNSCAYPHPHTHSSNQNPSPPISSHLPYSPVPKSTYASQSPSHSHSLHDYNFPSAIGPTSTSKSHRAANLSPPDSNFGIAGASSLSRSVSVDAAAPQQSSAHIVQRLSQQNKLIREAWEAERNYLEANRRRAEEVYQEERAIMEEVRDGWEEEKANLLEDMKALRHRVQQLETENTTLKAVAAQTVQSRGVVPSASRDQRLSSSSATSRPPFVGPLGATRESSSGSNQSHETRSSAAVTSNLLPPGLDGASRRPHFASSRASPRVSPTGQPDSSPFIPLDSHMLSHSPPARDFLAPATVDEADHRVVDINEIDPNLEGVSLRYTAVEKPTFASDDKTTPLSSPPKIEVLQDEEPSSVAAKRSSKGHTLQVLAVEESRRRTMHAGHTPNHSLSLFPTIKVDESVATSGPSDAITPTTEPQTAPEQAKEGDKPESEHNSKGKEVATEHDPIDNFDDNESMGFDEDIGPMREPIEDAPLKGPLMMRNFPAKDELFLEALKSKLEPISRGQNALPTALRNAVEELDADAGPSDVAAVVQQHVAPLGGDGTYDATEEVSDKPVAQDGNKPGNAGIEGSIPLKLKTTTNFGAPFGMA